MPSPASRAAILGTGPDAVYVQRVPARPSIFVAPTAASPEFTQSRTEMGSGNRESALRASARRMPSAVSAAARA
jgi:hypothetical protein